jgi:very-short-patch-repair endonuclease
MLYYKTSLTKRARKLRRKMTLAEKKIWSELLRKDQLEGFRFLRQKPLDNYIADFYCAELLLVIEIDGESHLSPDAKEYDEHRTKVLNAHGIEVVRYTNQEVLNHLDNVEKDLRMRVLNKKNENLAEIKKDRN